MLELLHQQIEECQHGLTRLRAALDLYSRADRCLEAAQAMKDLGEFRLKLARLAQKTYGPLKPPGSA